MLKRSLALSLVVLCQVSAASAASPAKHAAVPRMGEVEVGVNAAVAMATENDMDSTGYIGGTFAYNVTESVAVGLSGGWKESDMHVTVAGAKLNAGSLSAIPLIGEVIWRIPPPPTQNWTPYLIGGVGGVIWSLDHSTELSSRGLTDDLESAFAVKVGGGIEWRVDDRWYIYLEGAYYYTDAELKLVDSAGGVAGESGNLDFWNVGGGVKYRV